MTKAKQKTYIKASQIISYQGYISRRLLELFTYEEDKKLASAYQNIQIFCSLWNSFTHEKRIEQRKLLNEKTSDETERELAIKDILIGYLDMLIDAGKNDTTTN